MLFENIKKSKEIKSFFYIISWILDFVIKFDFFDFSLATSSSLDQWESLRTRQAVLPDRATDRLLYERARTSGGIPQSGCARNGRSDNTDNDFGISDIKRKFASGGGFSAGLCLWRDRSGEVSERASRFSHQDKRIRLRSHTVWRLMKNKGRNKNLKWNWNRNLWYSQTWANGHL